MNGAARHTDPSTSFDAANSVNVAELEQKVWACLASEGAATTEELTDRLSPLSLVTISPRMAPLRRKGLVRGIGKKRNRSGRAAIIWEAVR